MICGLEILLDSQGERMLLFRKSEVEIMGKMTLEEVRAVVHELSPEDKEILSIELSYEIRKVDPEIEKSWLVEAKRRWKEFEEGKVKGIPGEEAFARIRQKLHEARSH
jgi:hypothetical protein